MDFIPLLLAASMALLFVATFVFFAYPNKIMAAILAGMAGAVVFLAVRVASNLVVAYWRPTWLLTEQHGAMFLIGVKSAAGLAGAAAVLQIWRKTQSLGAAPEN